MPRDPEEDKLLPTLADKGLKTICIHTGMGGVTCEIYGGGDIVYQGVARTRSEAMLKAVMNVLRTRIHPTPKVIRYGTLATSHVGRPKCQV